FFVLALATWCWPAVLHLQASICRCIATNAAYRAALTGFAAVLVLAPVISLSQYDVVVRDKDLLSDVATIHSAVPARSLIAASAELRRDFQLTAYLYRYHYIS